MFVIHLYSGSHHVRSFSAMERNEIERYLAEIWTHPLYRWTAFVLLYDGVEIERQGILVGA